MSIVGSYFYWKQYYSLEKLFAKEDIHHNSKRKVAIRKNFLLTKDSKGKIAIAIL